MHFRRRKSRPEDQTSGELPDLGPNPARRADYQQIIDRLTIDEAIRTLPRGYQTAFNLYDVEGYKHIEIARLLGCSEGSSKSQLHKAKNQLAQAAFGAIARPAELMHSAKFR
jgi:RNA polymerase sigma-70 factor, ECF subfamily